MRSMMPSKLDMNEVNKEMETYEKDLAWVLDHYDSLIKRFGNEFIAVSNQKVLDHSTSIVELTDKLRPKYGNELNRMVIEFIYANHPNLVLNYASLLQAR